MNKKLPADHAKIFLGHFFIPATLVIAVGAFVVFSQIDHSDRIIDENHEVESISLNESVISGELESIISDVIVLSENSHLAEWLEGGLPQSIENLAGDFVVFSRSKKKYDQIRYIDEQGREVVRVNMQAGGPYVVASEGLQVKKRRYYFEDTFSLDKGEIYVSPFDLNIENGTIEKPLKPMIRFGTPVFNRAGEKKGIVVVNYLGARLLDKLKALEGGTYGHSLLVNSDGFFLKGITPDDEWGFMYPDRADKRMGALFDTAWGKIKFETRGQFYSEGSLFTFSTLYPVAGYVKSSTGSDKAFAPSRFTFSGSAYHWKVLSMVPSRYFVEQRNHRLKSMAWILCPILVLTGIGSLFLTVYRARRYAAEQAVIRARDELEVKVEDRTRDLNEKMLELERARDSIQASDRYYRSLINHIQEDIMVIDPHYVITDVNDTFLVRTGLSRSQVVGNYCYNICHGKQSLCHHDGRPCPIRNVFETGAPGHDIHQHGQGLMEKQWTDITFSPLRDAAGQMTHVIKVSRDISEERRLENQLRQAQKMEAIGRLAGGVAHDFNNILFPILGYAEMALADIGDGNEDVAEHLKEIMTGVLRARDLTSQILAFSYQAEQELKPLRIHIVVKEALKLLKSSIPSTITIETHIATDCGPVLCDARRSIRLS